VVRDGTFELGLHSNPASCGAAEAYALGTGSEAEEEEKPVGFERLMKLCILSTDFFSPEIY
jgi:hypothetical protein